MKPLNPIMAVLAIALVGAAPLRTLAVDGVTAPEGRTVASDDGNPVNALGKVLGSNPAARADAGKRIAEFLVQPDGQKSFLAKDVDKDAVGAVAREWGAKGDAGSVAVLYFVIGPGASVPAWAAKDPILAKEFVPGAKWPTRLRGALTRWTEGSQIAGANEKDQATAFLIDAANQATSVFADKRTPGQLEASVDEHDDKGPQAPSTRSPDTNNLGTMSEYTLKDLYEEPGAVVMELAGPKDQNARRISMKIYTKRVGDPPRLVDEIGIFDITDKYNITGKRFPLSAADKTFELINGGRKYELKFGDGKEDGDRSISFGRPDGAALTTSISNLFEERRKQVAKLASEGGVQIGGQTFFVLPQGGAKSGMLFFPADMVYGGSKDKRDLTPSLYAEVARRGDNGRSENLPPGDKGGPHLGSVGGAEFHLEWNNSLVPPAWDIKAGAGTIAAPAPAAKPSSPGAARPGAGASAAAPAGPDADPAAGEGADPVAAGDEDSVKDIEDLVLLATPGACKREDTGRLAPSLKEQFGMVVCKEKDGFKVIIITPASVTPNRQLIYADKTVRGGRLTGHFAVLLFEDNAQYVDLLKKDKGNLAASGRISLPEKKADNFADVAAYVDAMTTYMDFKPSDPAVTEIPKRVKEIVGSKTYTVHSSITAGVLAVTVQSVGWWGNVWPTVIKTSEDGTASKTPQPYTTLSGPANVMDGGVASVDADFPTPTLDLPDNRKASPVPAHTSADIALYQGVDEPKKYYLMYKYKALDPTDPAKPNGPKAEKVFRQKQFEIFNDVNPFPEKDLHAQGLVSAGAVVKTSSAVGYRYIPGSTKERGVFALFQNKQVSGDNQQDKKANCVGPLVWWGVGDREAAQKICEEDKF